MRTRLKIHQKFMIAVAVALGMVLLLAVGVWAYDDAQKDQIAPGVSIGGVDVGGRDADEARQVIEEQVVAPLRQPVVVTYDGDEYTLSPKRLHAKANVDGMVQEAIDASREGSILDRVSRYASGSSVDDDIEPNVGYDRGAVQRFVKDLADQINEDPVNASIVPSGDDLRPESGHPGVALDEDEMYNRINAAAESPGRDEPVEAVVSKTQPEINKKDLAKEYPSYITIDRSTFTLRLFKHLKLKKKYTIAVGQAGLETPAGFYTIQTKEVNPTWHVPDSDWAGDLAGQDIPPGPGNPLVARWMGIYNGAGIHGTDDIGSLGSAASHGCIRMAVDDVIELFDKVEVGDPVYIQ